MTRDIEDLTERAPSHDRNGRAAYRIETSEWDLSTAVVTAVEEVADCDLLAQDCVLYDVIDPDALERLFADGNRTTGRVVFELQGCRVEYHADGDLLVYEPRENPEESSVQTAKSA